MKAFLLSIMLILFSQIAVAQQPTSERLIRKGVSFHDRGDYKNAISYYEQALKLNPTSMSATYEMSLSYLKLKDYTNALKYSTKVINQNFQPLLSEAYCVKASALAESGKIDLSIKLLSEGLDKCGDDYQLNFNLGNSYFNGKDNKQALIYLQKAIEIDATHPDAFLLYAYALEDAGKWVQSILSFHFFLLLEPNTERSKDVFAEMYGLLSKKRNPNSPDMNPEGGVDRKQIYGEINLLQQSNDPKLQYQFFEQASKIIFTDLSKLQNDTRTGLLWTFYVPINTEILNSGYYNTYCRYVSSSYFPESLEWWNTNKKDVDNFITWFEDGQAGSEDSSDGADDVEDSIQVKRDSIPASTQGNGRGF